MPKKKKTEPVPVVPKMTVSADAIIDAFLDIPPDESEPPEGSDRAVQTLRNLLRVFEDLRSGRPSPSLDEFVVEDLEDVIRVLESKAPIDPPSRAEVRDAIDDALSEAVDAGVQWALTHLEDNTALVDEDVIREINKLRDLRVEVS